MPKDAVFGQEVTFVIDFHKDVSGIMQFGDEVMDDANLDKTLYRDVVITNGICRFTSSDLKMGRHYLTFDSEDYDIHVGDEFWVYPPVSVKNELVIGQDSFFTLNMDSDASGEIMFTLYSEEEDSYEDFTIYYQDGELDINSAGLLPGHYEIVSFEIADDKWGNFVWEESPDFDEDDVYFSFDAVYPRNALIVASNAVSTYTDGKVYKARVMIGTKAVEGATVVFKVNGKTVKTAVTDEKGFASFKITQVPGKYKLTITALGKTVSKKLTVKSVVSLAKTGIKKSAKKLTLTATLAKVNGKYLKRKLVTFKFNGIKYTKLTNSKGIAKITIPKAVYSKLKVNKKVVYQATYLKDTAKRAVMVSN